MLVFEGMTADAAWTQAALALRAPNSVVLRDGRGGPTREVINAAFVVADPTRKWVLARKPALSPASALVEVLWIVNGQRESKVVNFYNPRLPEYAGRGETYHGAYGYRLRMHFGRDQLEGAYETLRGCPQSRQAVLQVWDPKEDLPLKDGAPRSPDIPCNVTAMLKVVGQRLDWLQIARSNDLIRGVPYNFVQWTCLQEILAGWLGLDVGEYVHIANSLHVYEAEFDLLKDVEPAPALASLPLALPKGESDVVMTELYQLAKHFTSDACTEEEVSRSVSSSSLPEAYLNWLRIIAADASLRRGWPRTATALGDQCSDESLSATWSNWLVRQTP